MGNRFRQHSSAVLVPLGGALALIVVLCFEAVSAGRARRSAALGVLRDYAQFAAEELAGRIPAYLDYYGFGPGIAQLAVQDRTPGERLPSMAAIAAQVQPQAQQALRGVTQVFRVRAHDSLPTWGPGANAPDDRWLVDTLRQIRNASSVTSQRIGLIMHAATPTRSAIIYGSTPDSLPAMRTFYGFVIDRAALVTRLRMALRQAPLLPRTLQLRAGDAPIVAIRVLDDIGGVLVTGAAERGDPALAARADTPAPYGGIVVEAAIDPVLVPRLIAGGLPGEHVALVTAVGLIGVVLIIAVYAQWRRERELARLRDDFVAGVSHELRTPLAQIRMFSETLLLGRVRSDAESQRSIEIVDREARRLTHLVENLLHFSRSDRRITSVAPSPVRLGPIVAEIIEGFMPLAAAQQMTLRRELDDAVVGMVDADALPQILLNLLDNALKYGPSGQVITVRLVRNGASAILEVDDQGPGIPAGDRQRVWQRFSRLDRDRRAGISGTGIGLSVVRELTELHGGAVRIEDAPGGGARFVVELPAGADA